MRWSVLPITFLCASAAGALAAPLENSPPAGPAPVAAAAKNKPAPAQGDALELARLLNPEDLMLAVGARSFDQAFDKGMAGEGGGEAIEKEYPGLVAELRQATREVTLADMKADMPAIHRRYARLFAESFTTEELAELVAFYKSPAGLRIIKAKFANLDVSGMVDRFGEDPDAKMTASDVDAINDGATSGLLKDMSAEDFQAMLMFGLRPVGRKLRSVTPRIAEIEAEIANEPDPELDSAIEEASRKVYERHGLGDR